MAALKMVSKYGAVKRQTTCKLRFFNHFCLAMAKNLHRAKLSARNYFSNKGEIIVS